MPSLALAIAFAAMCSRMCHAGDVDPELMKERLKQQVQRMRSVEFTATIEPSDGGSDQGAGPRSQMVFYGKDGSFRSEVELSGTGAGTLRWVSVYDGDRYQTFDKTSGHMRYADSSQLPNPSLGVNPLVTPFLFLFQEGDTITWSSMKDDAVWDSKFAEAVYVETVREGEWTRDVLEFPGPSPGYTVQVHFARELDYYPVRSMGGDGDRIDTRLNVEDYQVRDLPGGPIVVPTLLTLATDAGGAESVDRIEVAPESIRINQEIDDQLFTLAASEAEWLHDVDRGTHLNIGGMLSTKELRQSSARKRGVRILAAAGALVIVLAGIALIARGKRGRRR